MKYPLVLATILILSTRADADSQADSDPQVSPLTDRNLPTSERLTSRFGPFGPLSPNGRAAASAALGTNQGPLLPLGHRLHHRGTLHLHVPVGACHVLCSILDLLVFNPEFSTFISLIQAADLVEPLTRPGPITLFVPTNAAFDHLPPPTFAAILADKDELRALLLRHMTNGAVVTPELLPGQTPLVTGAGETVTITAFPHQVTVTTALGVASIIDANNEASNGIVHVVDAVY